MAPASSKPNKPPPSLSKFAIDTVALVQKSIVGVQKVAVVVHVGVFAKIGLVFGAVAFGSFTVLSLIGGLGAILFFADLAHYITQYTDGAPDTYFTGIVSRIGGAVISCACIAATIAFVGTGVPALLTAAMITPLAIISYFNQKQVYDHTHSLAFQKIRCLDAGTTIVRECILQEKARMQTKISTLQETLSTSSHYDTKQYEEISAVITTQKNDILALLATEELCNQHQHELLQETRPLQQTAPLKFALLAALPTGLTLLTAALLLTSFLHPLGIFAPAIAVLVAATAVLRVCHTAMNWWPKLKILVQGVGVSKQALTIDVKNELVNDKNYQPQAIPTEYQDLFTTAESVLLDAAKLTEPHTMLHLAHPTTITHPATTERKDDDDNDDTDTPSPG